VLARPGFVEPSVFHSNIYENDVSSKIAFVQGFDDEPGSIVISFSHHVLNWSILTAKKQMDFTSFEI